MSGGAPQLTRGSLSDILQGQPVDKPILQVLNVKKIQCDSKNANDRYRLQLSDGEKYQPCMLATQMNSKIKNSEVEKYCVVRLNRYVCNSIQERKIIIIIDMTPLMPGQAVGRPLGQPVLLDLMRVGGNPTSPPSVSPIKSNGLGNQGGGGGGGGGVMGSSGRNLSVQRNNSSSRPGSSFGARGTPSTSGGSSYSNAAPPNRPGFDTSHGNPASGGILSQQQAFPISSLSPYQSRWTIRVRVASKPSIRTWSNSRGEGRVFNVDLVDESGEIRASAFNTVADKMHALFEMGKVYYISKGKLKPANRQFNTTNNDYELTLNEDTEVELCTDASSDASLPTIQYNFKSIADIESVEPNCLTDIIGICKDVSEVTSIITKTTNRKLNKREIYLVDRSKSMITCTLWGTEAEEFDGSQFPVVAVKGVKVSDFGGRSLSTVMSSMVVLNPDIPDAHKLRGWFDSVGKDEDAQSLSANRGGMGRSMDTSFLIFSQVKDLNLGTSDKPDYFSSKASIAFAKKDNCLYKACPNQDCNKKVTEGSGKYFCEKCNKDFPNFKYRLILTIHAADHSGSQWLTCFQDTGAEILGVDSQKLGEMRDNDEAAYDQIFQKINFKDFIFKIRAKMDNFNDEQRLKCYCVSVSPVNYAQETRRRVEEIKRIMAQ